MALSAYLTLKGKKQGDIKGSVTQRGHEGSIGVVAVDHAIQSPRDAATGLPTGKRMHSPLRITKQVDQSSPLLYQALANNETIVNWKLDLFGATGRGAEQLFYTIALTNAAIASIHFVVPDAADPAAVKLPDYEEVAFVYEKIQWTYQPGDITATDDWQAQIGV